MDTNKKGTEENSTRETRKQENKIDMTTTVGNQSKMESR
jgi:hypothetical protein